MSLRSNSYTLYALSEKAITIEFGNVIDEALLQKVTVLNQLIQQHPFPGMLTTVPAYATLTIFFDPLLVIRSEILKGSTCTERLEAYLQDLHSVTDNRSATPVNTISIPVCYGGNKGPDLDEVARFHQRTTAEVIALHSTALYTVYMIGFVPGFAYLGGLSEKLETPRRSTPRQKVPAGAVGIAGKQTGIYPLEIPGGWQIIGQTPVTLFDAYSSKPLLLKAGDKVRFTAIDVTEFELYSKASHAIKN